MDGDRQESAASGPTLEDIPRDECLRLLGRSSVGRVAVAEPGEAPLVVPVNFVLDGDTVVFRTDGSGRLGATVVSEKPVSFEIDGVDAGRRAGWSVLVQGTAAEVTEEEAAALEAAGSFPQPWAPGSRRHVVRILPRAISGRRIRPVPGWRWTQLS